MTKRKSVLQKISLVSAVLCIVLAFISLVMLYFKIESLGSDHPISASLMASTFFFVCIAAVLAIIGFADLPDFKFEKELRKD